MAVTKDESREKIREKANREYQRVQSVKKLSGTYNPVEREKLQREYRDALVALDNEAIGHRKNAALAQKEYDDYVNSQEFQQRKREAAVKLTQNVPASEVPRNAPQMMEIFEDETSQGLKAKADYYKKLSNDEKNRRVMAQDMAEINAMPEEDRKLFEQYAESQNAQRDGQNHGKGKGKDRQDGGDGQLFRNHLPHRHVIAVAGTHISMQQILQVLSILYINWLIQSIFGDQDGSIFFGSFF